MHKKHKDRIKIIQNLFAFEFNPKEYFPYQEKKILEKTKEILKKLNEIDQYIQKYATKFPIDKIAKVDLAILRLGIYEILFDEKVPDKVAIDEAINLAKEFGSERSYAFVNAVLEKVYKEKNEPKKA